MKRYVKYWGRGRDIEDPEDRFWVRPVVHSTYQWTQRMKRARNAAEAPYRPHYDENDNEYYPNGYRPTGKRGAHITGTSRITREWMAEDNPLPTVVWPAYGREKRRMVINKFSYHDEAGGLYQQMREDGITLIFPFGME